MMFRGAGVLLGLIFVGQIAERFTPKTLIVVGVAFMAVPAWFMAQWTVEVRFNDVAWTGFVQGFGGAFIIIASGLYIFHREQIRKGRKKA